ncbi:MAG: DUF2258 domain-containing protein [Candidatus Methanomethylicota archaeon]|uniref:DUF2258 domain-containing protein n=1 Tax=Thermoproteota archaeon TaxID=2056631 RepID=A0A497F069_9CREN|nr:MAG: DUF2258 domain-containing protein [Candidatus Verstraetearchaeota archaeon]
MVQLSTGLIIAGAYADKIRKTLFAQLRDAVKRGEVTPQEIARASAEINRILYHIIVDNLKSDKGDVIRARIEYVVEDGRITWKYDTLRLEYFKRVPDEEVSKAVEKVVSNVAALLERAVAYNLEKVLTTAYGDHIYYIKLDDRTIGGLIVTPVNEEMAIIRGAVKEPTPVVIRRGRLVLSGRSVDEVLSESIADVLKAGETVEVEEVERVLKDIQAIIERESS